MIINSGRKEAQQHTAFFTGQPEIIGGYWRRYDLVNSTFTNYLNLSPKNQARQIGGHGPYIKGTHTAELKINSELNGIYGHLAKAFKYHFLLTNTF